MLASCMRNMVPHTGERNLDCVRKCGVEEDVWSKRNEVTAARRRLSEEELRDMYWSSGDETKATAMTVTRGTYVGGGGGGRASWEDGGI
jgi:hypothetical protein